MFFSFLKKNEYIISTYILKKSAEKLLMCIYGGTEISQDSFFELLDLYFGEKWEIRTFVRIYWSLFIVLLNIVLSKLVLLPLPVITVVTMKYCIIAFYFFYYISGNTRGNF